jgi:excisionase family DNA binding protein
VDTALPKPSAELSALLGIRAVARLLGCSSRHVTRLAKTGQIPRPVKLGRLVRWRRGELNAFLSGDSSVRGQEGQDVA